MLNPDNETSLGTDEPILVPFDTLRAQPLLDKNKIRHDIVKCGFNIKNINIEFGTSDVELIITNQADFNKYIVCYEDQSVNFAEEFVLAGMTRVMHCIYIREQSIHLLRDTLTYTVVIGDIACALPEVANYIIVVSNKYLADFIKFKIIRG